MHGPPTSFWAKLRRDPTTGVIAWHSVEHHCADVAACFEMLLNQPVIATRLARLGGRAELDAVQRARLCVLAALHDLGKCNSGFQRRHDLPRTDPRTAGHTSEVCALLEVQNEDSAQLGAALGVERLASWFESEGAFYEFFLATLSHHGRPLAATGPYHHRLWARFDGFDPFDGVAALARKTAEWFPAAYLTEGTPLPRRPELQHGYCGLLTLADWLGSDESFFPFSEEADQDRISSARARAKQLAKVIGIDPAPARAALGPTRIGFSKISKHEPRDLQIAMLELPLDPEGSTVVLEAETGSGKTEAALLWFLRLFEAGLVDGLYFALPTRSAATQLHRRVVEAVARAFADEGRPPVTLAVPGYLAVDATVGTRLAPFDVRWDDDERDRWRFRGWAAEGPKRYLAAAVAVGTVDQVLLSTLQVRHSHLRAGSLLRHLLVVDEVHASDAYMTRLLEDVLSRHLMGGGHALLMSATLGTAALERLVKCESHELPSPREAADRPYPLVTAQGARLGRMTRTFATATADRQVLVELRPRAESPRDIAEIALDAALAGAKVLVIRNTVSDCIATQEAIEARAVAGTAPLFHCGDVPAPHHSRFARDDRRLLDEALEAAVGKRAPSRGVVVVATQTVQQSLDLDADYLISDLCPMDVLLQRLGRLHRHGNRARPSGFEQPRVVVLTPSSRDLGQRITTKGQARGRNGLGTVYADLRVLEATWRELERRSCLHLPVENRALVEAATHPVALRGVTANGDDRWGAHERVVLGVESAHRGLAGLNTAVWHKPFGDRSVLFPSSTDHVISTRLGEGDRLVRLRGAPLGPFKQPVVEVTMPAHLLRGADDRDEVACKTVHGGFTFEFGAATYRYDRLGLRPLRSRDSDEECDG